MKRFVTPAIVLIAVVQSLFLRQSAFADPPIPQSSTVVNLQFGPVVQSSDGNTATTGLLTGATVTATGGSTTTITTARQHNRNRIATREHGNLIRI
jgi:hypothetical protein